MPRVQFTRHLFRFFPALAAAGEIQVAGETVAEVVAALDRRFPGLAGYIVDERGSLRKHVNIFVGSEFIRDRERLLDPVEPDSEVSIFQALSGG